MVNTVDNVFVNTYESILRHLAQQMPTRLRGKVTERGVNSEKHNWERLGTAEAQIKTTRLQATPTQDFPWSRRVSVPQTYDVGDSTEQEDIVQMIIDPNSNLAQSQGYAMKRAYDDEIIAAATGTALDGLGAANPFPAAQKVFGVTVDVYDTSLNFDLVTQVTEKFLDNDIDPDELKCFVIGPVQARKLMQLTEATSADYVYVKALAEKGYVESWMGYQWIVSTRLNHPTAPGTDIDCFAMSRKALGLMVDRDVTSRIAEDPSISFAWRIYSFMTIGAVRVEDEHIVQVQLADTI
ncbi:hypothetical protein LCGC14_0903150 [marine sediment metagenome]|uniref:Capsid protein n=1 Tax=marine sediment metagenome TaxID=412755 RepID=A0A0F9S2N8_9ZZZZ